MSSVGEVVLSQALQERDFKLECGWRNGLRAALDIKSSRVLFQVQIKNFLLKYYVVVLSILILHYNMYYFAL